MNSGLMTFHHNNLDNFIEKPEYFYSTKDDSYVKTRAPTSKQAPPQVINTRLYGISSSHVFIDDTNFTYFRPVKYNVQILNESKDSTKVFGLVIIKINN